MTDLPGSAAVRRLLAEVHVDHRYYEDAESAAWLAPFWAEGTVFRRLFDRLRLDAVADFACGHGRHAAQIAGRAGRLVLVDVNLSNIEYCRRRFADRPDTSYLASNGRDLRGLADAALDSLFSYDAMVHFEPIDVINHLVEFRRVLKPGGRALLHHSVCDAHPEGDFRDHPGWRSYFSTGMMRHFATRAGFRILDYPTFEWPPGSSNPVSDGLVLLECA